MMHIQEFPDDNKQEILEQTLVNTFQQYNLK